MSNWKSFVRFAGVLLGVMALSAASRAASWTVLYHFPTNSYPIGALIQGSDGALYGTTQQGGSNGYGSAYRLTLSGEFTNFFSFSYLDGAYPYAGLLLGQDGAFYGTAQNGCTNGYGSVFRMTTSGQLSTLAAFNLTNGAYPKGRLLQAPDGALYGTTFGGGSNGMGTVFRITTNGLLTTLVHFAVTNGAQPFAGLTFGSDGALYGTTSQGGVNPTNFLVNYGSVFRMTTNGDFASLLLFDGSNGSYPYAGLTLADDGFLYGVSPGSSRGSVFRITTNGILTTIASVLYDDTGVDQEADLLQYFDGAFYSVAAQDNSSGDGTLYRVTTNGLITALIDFRYSGASRPQSKLLRGADGNLYGTATQGGLYGGGSVFRADILSSIFLFSPFRETNGWSLAFNGLPGDAYHVQRAANLSGPWTTFTNVTAGEFGDGHCQDLNPPPGNAFYRLAFP